ncbi:MAG: hypothetical protein ABW146_08490 [Candidatus Sedimenticola sp. 6PFRAG7]
MNKEKILALHQQHRDGQSKYVYFLLAVAASAIGFSVQKTTGSGFLWQQLPLGLAVGCWSLSFFFGCRHIKSTQIALAANLNYLKVVSSPENHESEIEYNEALDFHINEMQRSGGKARSTEQLQFGFLVAGFCLFLLWHLLAMYGATKCM